MTSSSTSQTSGIIESTIFLAALMFWTALRSTSRAMMNGLNSSSAISFGSPHWCSFSDGPETITERPGVVDALTEQVLAEPALLALEHVGERLQRPVAGPGDGPAAAAVVEQRVDGLLKHPLLVVDDDLGRAEVEQPLEAVVAVDDAAVEVVEVGGREPATVELHHRAQLRRDHRHAVEDHPLGPVGGVQERRGDLEPLHRAGLLLALGGVDRSARAPRTRPRGRPARAGRASTRRPCRRGSTRPSRTGSRSGP